MTDGNATAERTFIFVDLAGYTALTEVHGDEQAADLAGRFVELATKSLGPDDRLVKCIGDAVMLAAPDPAAGIALVARICAAVDAEPAFPVIRVGLHHGAAVERDGDWFGSAVNLAARLAAEAGGGEVFGTSAIAAVAPDIGADAEELGLVRLKNILEPVVVHRLTPCRQAHDRVIDPVCQMAIMPSEAVGRLRHDGHEHWFCSLSCANAFSEHPEHWET